MLAMLLLLSKACAFVLLWYLVSWEGLLRA